MSWIRMIVREVLGLFIDNGSFAVAIVVWLILTALVLPRIGIGAGWEGIILFGGLTIILVESATRRAR